MTFGRYLFTAIQLCLILPVLAQADKHKLKARISPDPEQYDSRVPLSVVSNDAKSFIVFKGRDERMDAKTAAKVTPKLELYDQAKFTLIRSMDPSEKMGKQTVILEDLVKFADSPMLIGTIRDLANGTLSVVATKVDPNITRASGPYEELVKFETELKGEHVGIKPETFKPSGFTFKISPNGEHLLIASPEVRDTVAGRGMYMIALIGKDRQVQWQHVVEVDDKLQRSELTDANVDDAGNVWLLVDHFYKGKNVAKGEIEQEVKLFHAGPEGIAGKRFGLERLQYVKTAALQRNSKGGLVLAGMHSTTAEGTKDPMIFVAEVPKSDADLEQPKIIKGSVSKPVGDGPGTLQIRRIVPVDNGGMFLLIEEYAHASIPHPKTLKPAMKHVRGPIHIVSLDPSGKENWTHVWHRYMHLDQPQGGSFYPVVFDGQLSLFMLESDKFIEKRAAADKKPWSPDLKDPYSVQVFFNEKGEPRSKNILGKGMQGSLIAGDEMIPIGTDRYVVFATSKLDGGGYLPADIEFSR